MRAGGQLLKFVGESIRERVHRLNSGRQIWHKLAVEHSAWQKSQGPVFIARLRTCPLTRASLSQSIAAALNACRTICVTLRCHQTRPCSTPRCLTAWCRVRPVWSTAAVAIRATLTGTSPISDIMARLVEMEREVELLRNPVSPQSAMIAGPGDRIDEVMSLLTTMRADLDDVRANRAQPQAPPGALAPAPGTSKRERQRQQQLRRQQQQQQQQQQQ